MIALRQVSGDADLELWAALKNAVLPTEPVTAEDLRRAEKPGRLLLLAELEGSPAGCGLGVPSSFAGCCFVVPRVLPAARRRGVGTALFEALSRHALSLGRQSIVAHVREDDPPSLEFAARRGFAEVDRQVELVRALGEEDSPRLPAGVEIVSIADRPGLLRAAYREIAVEAYADFPLADPIFVAEDEWLAEEATLPAGSFAALSDGRVVGYAGLLARDAQPGVAEHGLTAVARDWRRRGLATILKQAQLAWAARSGYRELVTFTQQGNEAMQAVNERLGYRPRPAWVTMKGPATS